MYEKMEGKHRLATILLFSGGASGSDHSVARIVNVAYKFLHGHVCLTKHVTVQPVRIIRIIIWFIHHVGLHKHGIYCASKVQTINIYGS